MDFGLAAVASELDASEIRSGTPAYMAPEQLAGREATAQSDLYALGLVLYEVFTGRPPFETKDFEELLRQRETRPAVTPSTIIPDLDRRIERAILRCLDPDPRNRPASPLEIAAALPGGDPLAEALAAGETPSPEMVAAAGPTEGLRPRAAFALVVCIVICLTTVLLLTPSTTVLGKLPLKVPPEELSVRARDIAHRLGFNDVPADVAEGFEFDGRLFTRQAQATAGSRTERRQQWNGLLSLEPWPLSFTHIEGPTTLTRYAQVSFPALPFDRSVLEPGRWTTTLDLQGRLLSFDRVPTSADLSRVAEREPDWAALFGAAGLDLGRFTRAAPTPRLTVSDATEAWTGSYFDARQTPVRIEASTFRGFLTTFRVVFPWTEAPPPSTPYVPVFFDVFLVALGVVGLRHWKQGRADTRGAIRFGVYAWVVIAAAVLLHPGKSPFDYLYPIALGFTAAMMYMAVEPWTRRLWPHVMITWARVLAGRWRDPVVGRDVLITVACVTSNYAFLRIAQLVAIGGGAAPYTPAAQGTFGLVVDNFASVGVMAANLTLPFYSGLGVALGLFLMLFALNAALRKKWLAVIIALVLWFAGNPTTLLSGWMSTLQWALEFAFLVFLTLRFGVFASALFSSLSMLISGSMFTGDFSAWYGRTSLVATLIISIFTIFAFRTSIGRQPILRSLETS
jgi:serine/threonine-protein kinase